MAEKRTYYLKIWKQDGPDSKGSFLEYKAQDISVDMSFLEVLDEVNQKLIHKGERAIEFDHDCREGICGSCALMINAEAHGPEKAITSCQLHMRSFPDKSEIVVEPFRARAFPIVRDLVVDRSSFDRIIQKAGFVSVNTGNASEANSLPVAKDKSDEAFLAAACIGCGACVSVCKNASASLFVSAKLAHLHSLPQGEMEKQKRTLDMIEQMDQEGFGACTNTGACSRACPKEIKLDYIARMNATYLKSSLKKIPSK